jgi:hypothetical protein
LVVVASVLINITYPPVIAYIIVCCVSFCAILSSNRLWYIKRRVIVYDIPMSLVGALIFHVICRISDGVVPWLVLLLPPITIIIYHLSEKKENIMYELFPAK